jgi:hypothetical protein
VKRSLAVAACVAACLAGIAGAALPVDPRAQEATGELRILVIRATWGPRPELAMDFHAAEAFYARSSFGRLQLRVEVTPWLSAYSGPQCPTDPTATSVFGTLGERAQSAAVAAGYDLRSYGRLVYIIPEKVCSIGGIGALREVYLAGDGDYLGFVHELGHTFGLPHANSSVCARGCRIAEYGDPLSPMGAGATDFTALEKLKLGWISGVQRVDASRTYAVGNIDEPSSAPQALVVPTDVGEYWIERRSVEPRQVIVRLVKPNDVTHPVYLRSIFLARADERYRAPGVFTVTPEFQFRWLDRERPTRPKVRALDHTVLSWSRSSDAGSGVAGYRISIDGKLFETTEDISTTLPLLRDGSHRVVVVAFDRAGNRSRPGVVSLQV